MRKVWIAAVLLMVMIMGGGCAKGAPEGDVKEPETEAEDEGDKTEPWTEEDERELYNLYVQINNVILGDFGDSIGKYFEYVEYQEEFSVLEEDYFCYPVSEDFFWDLDRADALLERKEEHVEEDTAYLALSPVVRELGEILNEVYAYTEEDTFLEDDFAKGKELHARLFASCTEYEPLAKEFVDKIQLLSDERRWENLAKMKEEGYEVSYALMQMLLTAQEIQGAILEQGIEDDTRLLELDAEALEPLYKRYQEEVAAATAYLGDSEALEHEGFPTASTSYLTLQEAAENSLKELETMFQNVAEQKQPGSYGASNTFVIEGTLAGFYSKVATMIDEYNRIIG